MIYKYQYNTPEERQNIIIENSNLRLIEEQNLTEGDFLIFEDGKFPIGTPLEEAKAAKAVELQNARDNIIESTFVSDASGETHTYGYNEKDQFIMLKQAKFYDLNPTLDIVPYKSHDGLVMLSKIQFNQLMLDAASHENEQWQKWFPLDTQRESATTIEQVEAIVWI